MNEKLFTILAIIAAVLGTLLILQCLILDWRLLLFI